MTNWRQVYDTSLPGMKKAGGWLFGNALFGSLPFLSIWILMKLSMDHGEVEVLKHKQVEIFRDCAVMFLCCTITGAALLDFGLSKTKPVDNATTLGIMAPACMVVWLVILLFVNSMKAHGKIETFNGIKYIELSTAEGLGINLNLYGIIQLVLIVFSILYSFIIKTYIYTKEGK